MVSFGNIGMLFQKCLYLTMYLFYSSQILKDGLTAVHVPYSYGFAIILLTVLVKVATFPLTKQQVT